MNEKDLPEKEIVDNVFPLLDVIIDTYECKAQQSISNCNIHSDCIFGCLSCGNYRLK